VSGSSRGGRGEREWSQGGQWPAGRLVVAAVYYSVAVVWQAVWSKDFPLNSASAALLLRLAIDAHSLAMYLPTPSAHLSWSLECGMNPGSSPIGSIGKFEAGSQ